MTSEKEFEDYVEEYLQAKFGAENVHRQYYFEESRRYADFLIEDTFVNYALELENDFEAVWKGISQAQVYSAHRAETVPIVVVPSGVLEKPEASMLPDSVTVVEIDMPDYRSK